MRDVLLGLLGLLVVAARAGAVPAVVVEQAVPGFFPGTETVTAAFDDGTPVLRIFVESDSFGAEEQCTFPTSAVTIGQPSQTCTLTLQPPDALAVWLQDEAGAWVGPASVWVPSQCGLRGSPCATRFDCCVSTCNRRRGRCR